VKQLTIRGFEPELERELHRLARAQGISLNKAALDLMRRGAGLEADSGQDPETIGNGLDAFIGSWNETDERRVLEAVKVFESIDEDLWR